MDKENNILISQIHKYFGSEFNTILRKYFFQSHRSEEETDYMIELAYASLLHWKLFSGGTIVNVQRGEYMISKAYLHAGNKIEALAHAKKCLNLTELHSYMMKDFDKAYSFELMASVYKMNGDISEFEKYKSLAEDSGNKILDQEDRDYFFDDLEKNSKHISAFDC